MRRADLTFAPLAPASRRAVDLWDGVPGRWRTLRVIRQESDPTLRFDGITEWAPEGGTLRCREVGRLMQGTDSFQARRETVWQKGCDAIDVTFADGRPFHRILDGDRCVASHDCAPDTYVLTYNFAAWPLWSVRWQVSGPRKAYRALTWYRRAIR
ncbi:MAG: DUF6314 family protein [Pseudomonadota bacterium]